LQRLAALLPAFPATAEVSAAPLLWGERFGRELALITAQPLTYPHIMALKRACPDIEYIRHEPHSDFVNVVVGILNARGDYTALGVLRSLDFASRQAKLSTPAPPESIAGITLSRYTSEE